jgi:hypothetical protein
MDPPSHRITDSTDAALWSVWRMDETGNRFFVCGRLTREEAERTAAEFEARGHKQTYWAEKETTSSQAPSSRP